MQFLTIPVDPKQICALVDWTGDTSEKIHNYIGDYFETSTLWMPYRVGPLGAVLYVDDRGLHKELPFNPRAACLRGLFYTGPATIVGPAVVSGFDEHGDTQNVPSHIVEIIRTIDKLYKELMRAER
jgi:hypothetical protein